MAKTHYATADRYPESNMVDWGDTLCGLEYTESPVTDKIEHVNCKHCIKAHPKFKKAMQNIHL